MSAPTRAPQNSRHDQVSLVTLLVTIQQTPNKEVFRAIETQIARINAQRKKISNPSPKQDTFSYNYMIDSFSVGC